MALGLVTAYDDPVRNRIDNALFLLGAIGLVNAWLVRRARLLHETVGVRISLAIFAALSGGALGLADFGAYRRIGWGIKAVGVALLALVFADVLRGSSRSPSH